MKTYTRAAVVVLLSSFACAARAQSSVTLYGMVDILMDISNQGNGTLTRMTNGGLAGSRIGLAGVEELGNGYKAIFKLENGFASNTGVIEQGGALFGRQAWVGLQGPQGSLTFGRQYAPEFLAVSDYDAFFAGLGGSFWNFDRTLSNGTVQSTLMTDIITCRTNNSIVYSSPTVQGVSFGLMYGVGGVPGSISGGATISGALNYANGPLALHAGYLHMKDASDPGYYEEWGVGGNFVIGPAKLYAGYTKDIYPDTTTPATIQNTQRYAIANLGVKYMLRPSLALIGQVSKIIDTSDGLGASQNAYVEAVEINYQLSKRTSVYGGYSQVNNKNGSAYSLGAAVYYGGPAVPDTTSRVFQFGMRTLF
ncbi:gram-negative porin family protein [Paraburkholderia xenovorans LB400]|jgi:predicted porin|uniref:Outer membrane porin, OmpC family n=1 Tax=Paraburkholderia xenovorans (strain LB400) TaxID=266265 RepID=Q140L4_PARXL|nr:porin [Paraburkholderia xenovorans]ABE30225.1 outer membrane porin, OmpC family [Paraburkholderia xenovorans LB400]AIP29631.1 gram-negative porin family protein [Paraburkholderia xenovorans LB400]